MSTKLSQSYAEAMGLNIFSAHKKAERFANEWADYASLSEDEKEDVVDQYLRVAFDHVNRTKPLTEAVSKLIEAAEQWEADEGFECSYLIIEALANLRGVIEGRFNG